MSDNPKRRRRWGPSAPAAPPLPQPLASANPLHIIDSIAPTDISAVSDEAAIAALLASAAEGEAAKKAESAGPRSSGGGHRNGGGDRREGKFPEGGGRGGGGFGKKRGRFDGRGGAGAEGDGFDFSSGGGAPCWGKRDTESGDGGGDDDAGKSGNNLPPKEKRKADFGLSGALATDERTGNVYRGVVLKFVEPPEARAPNTRWRFYVFKKNKKKEAEDSVGGEDKKDDGDLLEVMHISKQSAYLFGRDRRVADVPVDHLSLSGQHCVLQYRALPDRDDPSGRRLRCRPYVMDLGSTNGTYLNGVRVEEARYYELRRGDVITLGASSREYVLLTENTTAASTGR